ncbi:LysR family transcriptional regulator [Shimia sp. CNT1-13L.2]|uniref:LysR family transcriptional regulator n=1 Tax=Shimia sp. CNT1-13L.2 TaxID=2959663 RepID=UPI0020CC97BF|nr:LysR family transcriptional regulator [Shimia sp. CNT1-13L.2]MCP9483323.1 LysR family transcriptional regulator [Shimia sp. CNT1-13L.2]
MNLNSLDLNLLKAFDALYRERHVGRAGAAIGLAQPSMSNALNRLRAQFEDPLFQRGAEGMTPTARAEELAPKVKESLAIIAQMLRQSDFDPMTADGQVLISASDLAILRLSPAILRYFEQHAPNLTVHFVPMQKKDLVAKLDNDEVTVAIGTFGNLPARFHRKVIMPDSFVCIARKNHPLTRDGMTLEAFLKARHFLMTLNNDKIGVVDRALKQQGKKRRVVMTCAQFALLPDIVAQSDGMATVPASLLPIAERAGCDVFDLPLTLPKWDSEMVWTQKTAHDPLGRFVISSLAEASKSIFHDYGQ